MSNGKNKTNYLSLLLDQWPTDKYASKLENRNLSHVIGEVVSLLTYEDDNQISRRGYAQF